MANDGLVEFEEFINSLFNSCIRNVENNPEGWTCGKPYECLGCGWYEQEESD